MIRLVAFAALAAAALTLNPSDLAAQQPGVSNGYEFGYGFGQGRRFDRDLDHGFIGRGRLGFNGFSGVRERIERPPYFALFPPVYYDATIIRRPMGVSPFAAPPGIMPVEMTLAAPSPTTVVNPYFKKKAPVKVSDTNEDNTDT